MKYFAASALLVASLLSPGLLSTAFAHHGTDDHVSTRAYTAGHASASVSTYIHYRASSSTSHAHASAHASASASSGQHSAHDHDSNYDDSSYDDSSYDDSSYDDSSYDDSSYDDSSYQDSRRDDRFEHRTHPRKKRTRRHRRRVRRDHRHRVHRCDDSCTVHHVHDHHCGHQAREPQVMSQAQFAAFLAQIEDENFSSGRLRVVQMAAMNNYFTSTQVMAVVGAMTFSSNKVESAVLLYPRVVDPDEFYRVFAAFTFESNKEEVQQRLALY